MTSEQSLVFLNIPLQEHTMKKLIAVLIASAFSMGAFAQASAPAAASAPMAKKEAPAKKAAVKKPAKKKAEKADKAASKPAA